MAELDVLIIGGGIAGASLGAQIAGQVRTAVIEAESHCGMHATGRSAAFWLESYGGPDIAVLSAASHDFLEGPPSDFSEHGFLRTRGALHLARDQLPELPPGVPSRLIEREELERMLPGVRPDWKCALLEPGCADIDVAGLHGAYLRQFRLMGGEVATDARLMAATRRDDGWTVRLDNGSTLRASTLVNAAGAWADPVAEACGVRPIGIAPKRRTMVQLRVGRTGLRELPLVDDAAGTFYFKGEGDRSIWLTPHDEIDSDPCDAAPDQIDIATAIDRFEQAVDWPVEAVERSWAGLRSFACDRVPVYGFDPDVPSFFWCVGQGGFGIQTAPAASSLAASLLLRKEPEAALSNIHSKVYSPARFRD
jgi:D-arginine dehydrogenase